MSITTRQSARGQNHTIKRQTLNYKVSKDKALNKKCQACNRAPLAISSSMDGQLTLKFSTAAFEIFRKILPDALKRHNLQTTYREDTDTSGSIIQDIITATDENGNSATINLYRTTCTCLINGATTLTIPMLDNVCAFLKSTNVKKWKDARDLEVFFVRKRRQSGYKFFLKLMKYVLVITRSTQIMFIVLYRIYKSIQTRIQTRILCVQCQRIWIFPIRVRGKRVVVISLQVLAEELSAYKLCSQPLHLKDCVGEQLQGLGGWLFVKCGYSECHLINKVRFGSRHDGQTWDVNTKLAVGRHAILVLI